MDEYLAERRRRAVSPDPYLGSQLKKHVLGDDEFASIELAKLREHHFDAWRSRLPIREDGDDRSKATIGRSTFNRVANDLRASLNAAARRYRRELPAQIAAEIAAGTRALPVSSETARMQILSDKQVAAVVRAAFDPSVDIEGDFGRLVAVLAATGARFSQVARIRVGDVDVKRQRVFVPASAKGRTRKSKPAAAVPIDKAVVELLRPAMRGRAADAPLLARWSYRKGTRIEWVKDKRGSWSDAHQMDGLWHRTVAIAKVPTDTIPYALRHSSIVRALRAGVPLRIVAANHDTSTAMIERHYGRFISEAGDDLARAGSLRL
ncbi:MAG TPA: phage integrase family protein [Alphaproteobacteria bacterium]|nr:phage integrase family protein [Alphaproteobacteria bacterium]